MPYCLLFVRDVSECCACTCALDLYARWNLKRKSQELRCLTDGSLRLTSRVADTAVDESNIASVTILFHGHKICLQWHFYRRKQFKL
jgi:hypothetical protein